MRRRTTKRLEGRAKLSDDREFNADVRYELLYTFEEPPPPGVPPPEFANDLTTGRLETIQGGPIPSMRMMTLTFEDGMKLRVATEFNGKVLGSGTFYR
jgi:hypothetical protein